MFPRSSVCKRAVVCLKEMKLSVFVSYASINVSLNFRAAKDLGAR